MSEYFIYIKNIEDETRLTFEVYKFSSEESLIPQKTDVELCEDCDRLLSIIEDILCNSNSGHIVLLGTDEYFKNYFDVEIDNFSRIEVNYCKANGYKVTYIPKQCNIGNNPIDLLDTSASGFMRYIRKIVQYK